MGTMEQWYTLYTKPNSEYQVAHTLERRGIHTYLPEIEAPKTQRKSGREPFFPCYLFTRVDFTKVGLSQVRWTPGLRRVVAFGEHPVPLPDEVIELIQRKLDAINATGGRPGHSFQPGETVQITDGPLQGLLAVFEGPSTPTERVQVLLSFLGHTSRAHVPVTDLQKAPPEAEAPAPKRRRSSRGRGRPIRNQSQPDTGGRLPEENTG
jgi:transcriptional antiterminator RfaH